MKKPALLFLLIAPVSLLFFGRIAYASTDHLWISQVQITGGPGKTTNDFVEIYNPTSSDVDLNGMRLVKRTATGTTDTSLKSWTDSTIIKAGGYYLWANSNFSDIAIAADVTTSGSLADDNAVALRLGASDTGTIIDSLAWGASANAFEEGSVFATNPPANQALVRSQDTDDNSVDFSIADSAPRNSTFGVVTSPSPNPPPPPPVTDPSPNPPPPPPASNSGGGGISQAQYSQAVIISEFLANPDGSDTGEEWIELYNPLSSDIDLSGWKLDDESQTGTIGSSAYTFPAGSIIHGLGFFVVDLGEGSFALNNTGGDSVRLIWPNKQIAVTVDYTNAAKVDISYARKPDNTYGWTSEVSKGRVNQFVESTPETEKTSEEPVKNVVIEPPKIVISEFFPEPERKSDQEEFIELFNQGDKEVDLTGFKISDLASSYKLDGKIAANGFFVIKKTESNISLNNSGAETLTLADVSDKVLSTVSYEDAPKNQSYNLMPDGLYYWSVDLTPGNENQIKAAAAPVKSSVAKKAPVLAAITSEEEFLPESGDTNLIDPGAESFDSLQPQVAGSVIENSSSESSRAEILWWLVASFALNLIFCYSLVRLMLRKKAYESR